METDTPLVWADGVIELHAVTQVGLYFPLVVHPCDAESENTVGFY